MSTRPSFPELIADGLVHGLAIVTAIIASVFLIIHAAQTTSSLVVAAVCVYCAVMLLSFTVSGIYNMWPYQWMREPLRRVDHAAIYLKIAGTYTPLVVILGSLMGYIVLAFIWTVALGGVIGKLAVKTWPNGLNTGLTLTLGWSALILLWPLIGAIPGTSLWLIFLGGVLYSVGTIFYLWRTLKYQTAIWHMFVLAGSASLFAAIVVALG
ncbi:MAG: PAQR family membrane homeostasis protein TrhA [Planktomarina sp.]